MLNCASPGDADPLTTDNRALTMTQTMRLRTDRPGRDGREPGPEHREPRILASRSSTAPSSKVDDFMAGRAKGKNFVGCHSLEELVGSLASPRKVMLMVKAGPAVDEFIEKLIPLLSPGDVIIDGGNTLLQRHRAPHAVRRVEGPAVHRHGRLRRRRRRAEGPEHDARRQRQGLAAGQADLPGDRRQGRPEQRHPLLRMGRPARRRPLREDGPQRHRVRRHAVDLRGLLDAQAAPWA